MDLKKLRPNSTLKNSRSKTQTESTKIAQIEMKSWAECKADGIYRDCAI